MLTAAFADRALRVDASASVTAAGTAAEAAPDVIAPSTTERVAYAQLVLQSVQTTLSLRVTGDAIDWIPRLVELAHAHPPLQHMFAAASANLPAWVFLKWLPHVCRPRRPWPPTPWALPHPLTGAQALWRRMTLRGGDAVGALAGQAGGVLGATAPRAGTTTTSAPSTT